MFGRNVIDDSFTFKAYDGVTDSASTYTITVSVNAAPNVTDTTQMFPAVASIGQSAIDQKSIVISGSVLSAPKDYRTGSSDEPQYADSGSAIYTYKGGTGGVFEAFNTNFNAPISNSAC